MTDLRTEIRDHFAGLARDYDEFKRRNSGYYTHLKRLYRQDFGIQPGARVLEIGCGTGEVLASLNPSFGVGIDLVPEMVQIAQQKFSARPELAFVVGEAECLPVRGRFDWIIAPDVLEHLHDLDVALNEMGRIAVPGTRVILSWANPLWEPALHLLERLRLKMPEGPHNWHSPAKVIRQMRDIGLEPQEIRGRFPLAGLPAGVNRRLQEWEKRRGRLFRVQLIVAVMFGRV